MMSHLDCLVNLEVQHCQETEGEESHPQEVGNEDIVPAVGVALPQVCGAHPGSKEKLKP